MGEYHFYPEQGFKGSWFDPIADWDFKGPSWRVTSPRMDGVHFMEQQRVTKPRDRKAIPVLRAGDIRWTDVTVTVQMCAPITTQISGFLFRYQTSMMHYGLFLAPGGIELQRVNKLERTVLARCETDWNPDIFHELKVTVTGSHIEGYLDGRLCVKADDTMYTAGCIALCACMPAQYASVSVTADEKTFAALNKERCEYEQKLAGLRAAHARPVLYKAIDLNDFGAGRQIRFGHLTGTKELFFIMCQPQLRIYKDR